MIAGIVRLAMLAVFSVLSMNLILQFCLGIKETAFAQISVTAHKFDKRYAFSLGFYYFWIIILWMLISVIRSLFTLGFLEYILLFPVSFLSFCLYEYLLKRMRFFPDQYADFSVFGNAYTGGVLLGAALFITLNVAGGLLDAAALAFGFTLGIALAIAIAGEIRRRSEIEAVPRFLKGGPLMLISMGLLSLIFSSAALMFFLTLGAN